MLRSALLPLALLALSDTPRLAPKAGLASTKSLEWRSSSHLEGWSARMGGNPVPAAYLPKLELDGETVRTFEWSDEFLACKDGKLARVRREFLSIAGEERNRMTMNGQAIENVRNGSSALEGCTVLLDETAKGEARRLLEHGECPREALDALAIDLEFSAFLAGAGGDEVTLGVGAFNPFDENWGGVALAWDGTANETHVDAAQLASNAKGEWKVRQADTRTVEGRKLAVLALSGRFESACELDGELQHVPVADGPTRELSEMVVTLEGELLWDLRRNVLDSLTLEGDSTLRHVTRTVAENAGQPAYEQTMEFSGKLSLQLRAAPLE